MKKLRSQLVFQLTSLVLVVTTAAAQLWQKPLRVDVDLVNMYVTVRTSRGRLVSTLSRDSFAVFEDNAAQTLTHFSRETNVPLTLALVIDTSGSVAEKLWFERRAAAQFLQEVMSRDTDDKAAIITFDTYVQVQQDYTNDSARLVKSLLPIRAGGGTCLYDALYSVIRNKLSGADRRKVVVVITDGEDNISNRSPQDVVEVAQRNDVSIFAVSTNRLDSSATKRTKSDAVLETLVVQTGGSFFLPSGTDKLASDFNKLADELHAQYALAYRSTNSVRDGSFRSIHIDIPHRDYLVQTRAGYYAPN